MTASISRQCFVNRQPQVLDKIEIITRWCASIEEGEHYPITKKLTTLFADYALPFSKCFGYDIEWLSVFYSRCRIGLSLLDICSVNYLEELPQSLAECNLPQHAGKNFIFMSKEGPDDATVDTLNIKFYDLSSSTVKILQFFLPNSCGEIRVRILPDDNRISLFIDFDHRADDFLFSSGGKSFLKKLANGETVNNLKMCKIPQNGKVESLISLETLPPQEN